MRNMLLIMRVLKKQCTLKHRRLRIREASNMLETLRVYWVKAYLRGSLISYTIEASTCETMSSCTAGRFVQVLQQLVNEV